MNKQRKVVITTTYNEMGIIIDTKAEEVVQPEVAKDTNVLTNDCISRQAVIDALDKRFDSIPMEQTTEILQLRKDLRELPSAQTETHDKRAEMHACDLISRAEAIDALENIDCSDGIGISALKCDVVEDAINAINALPPAQPERNRGKWIEDDDGWDEVIWRCSECDAVFTLVDGTPEENEYYFCPHCGADMRKDEQE